MCAEKSENDYNDPNPSYRRSRSADPSMSRSMPVGSRVRSSSIEAMSKSLPARADDKIVHASIKYSSRPIVANMPYTTPLGEFGYYNGEVNMNGSPHGEGRMSFINGKQCSGQWRNGYIDDGNKMKQTLY